MVISVFILAFRCDVAAPWIFINTQCSNLVRPLQASIYSMLMKAKLLRWEVETAFDIITELALFSASIQLVKGLQSSFLTKKITVVFAFGTRLL